LEVIMLTSGLTNLLRVVPDKSGPLPINVIAADIEEAAPGTGCPRDLKEARALLEELQARNNRPPSGASLRSAQYSEMYNGALRDMAKAKRFGLYPKDFMFRPPPSNCTPDDLRQLQDQIGEMHEKLEAFEARRFDVNKEQTAEQRRIIDAEQRIKQLEAKLRQVIDHHNKLVADVNECEARCARLEGVMALGPRLVQPALTAVQGHADLIEKRESP
jgi:hypothetical protein